MSLFLADGTRVTQATIPVAADPDPLVVLQVDLYEKRRTGREDDKPQGELTFQAARAGKVLRQSQVNALFKSADVHSALPDAGTVAGGTEVVIRGNYLDGVAAVSFGGVAAASVTVVSDREVRAVSPAAAGGVPAVVDLVITDDKGTTTLTGAFTYE